MKQAKALSKDKSVTKKDQTEGVTKSNNQTDNVGKTDTLATQKHPKSPMPPQHQSKPGTEVKMNPRPE
jgi:hypothetical protein